MDCGAAVCRHHARQGARTASMTTGKGAASNAAQRAHQSVMELAGCTCRERSVCHSGPQSCRGGLLRWGGG